MVLDVVLYRLNSYIGSSDKEFSTQKLLDIYDFTEKIGTLPAQIL